jgi:transposase
VSYWWGDSVKSAKESVEVDLEELEKLLEGKREALGEEDYQKLKKGLWALRYLTDLIGDKDTTISQLRALLIKPSTEKTNKVLEQAGVKPSPQNRNSAGSGSQKRNGEIKPGHGRHGAEAYRGAERIQIAHASLKPGDGCPHCGKGKVYEQKEPALRIRVVGQAPVAATVYELQRLRCNLCGDVFEAEAPPEVGEKKYNESAAAMIGLLKYGSGVPFYRLAGLEENLGIPLPASTQWEIVEAVAKLIRPVFDELIRQGAQGEVFCNDDTRMKILALARASPQQTGTQEETSAHERTGLFTSGIVSTRQGRRIALFFTGQRHAGENLAQVLAHRAAELPPPIQVCDASTRNVPKLPEKLQTILGNCNAHARRRFVDVVANFPEECRYVLETFAEVYRYDAQAEERGLSPEERLRFHQAYSQPVMDKLHIWLRAQFDERKVEPNSGLGIAIRYVLRHWHSLTLFLRQAGAPLDSNVVERALKKAILHRKNSQFYKTKNGAGVGDLFMSLIHTCELNGANPFDYLIELQKHASDLAKNPAVWMPWNYQDILGKAGTQPPR